MTASIVLVGSRATRAELPPTAYMAMQAAAPELLNIRVTEVADDRHGQITLDAVVVGVTRTAGSCTEGAHIRIQYHVPVPSPDEPPMAGPSSVPVLAKGDVRPAYLRRVGDLFEPAAGGMTFDPLRPAEFATDDLTVKVVALSRGADGEIRARLDVVAVQKSESHVEPADVIEVIYAADAEGPGPLDLRQTYHSLLVRREGETAFRPGMGADRFEPAAPTTQPAR